MFGASIIVFRESLEAALLIGIIAAATRSLAGRNRWLALGVGAGLLGSLVVAWLTEFIAMSAEGRGQEFFNAAILGIAVLMLAWHNIWMASHGAEMASKAKQVGADIRNGSRELSAIAIVIALAVMREGSETALFLHGIASSGTPDSAMNVFVGGGFGLLIGATVGLGIYFGLLRIPVRWFFTTTSVLVLLLAAGLASQMARLLIQVDWLPTLADPLWDTSAYLSNDSTLGTLLHILIGYDAQPAGMQVIFYFVTFLSIAIGTWLVRRRHEQANGYRLKMA